MPDNNKMTERFVANRLTELSENTNRIDNSLENIISALEEIAKGLNYFRRLENKEREG